MHNRNVFLKMTKTRRFFFVVFSLLTVLWAGVIFGFSATDGGQSVAQSNGFIKKIYNLMAWDKTVNADLVEEKPASKNEIKTSVQMQDEVKNQQIYKEEIKSQEAETEKTKTEEAKTEEIKTQEIKAEEIKPQETQQEQSFVSQEKNVQNTVVEEYVNQNVNKKTPYVLNKNTNVLIESEQKREERFKNSIEKNRNIPMFEALNSVIRKVAHISSYALLAFLAYFAVGSLSAFPKKNAAIPWVSVILCVLFACTDEYHQSFVYGRSGRISDVIVDSFGVFAGTLVAFWLAQGLAKIKLRNKHR